MKPKLPSLPPFVLRAWRAWFTPRTTDPLVAYRERSLRILLTIIIPLRLFALIAGYTGQRWAPTPYFSLVVSVMAMGLPLALSIACLTRRQIDLACLFFILHWYLVDVLNLPAMGYWSGTYQTNLVLEMMVAAYLLPGWTPAVYLGVQLATVGAWGGWVETHLVTAPRLATGGASVSLLRMLINLSIQETVLVFLVHLLRQEVEAYLRRQSEMIGELERQIADRQRAEAETRHALEREQRLSEVTRAVNSSLDLSEVLSTLVRLAVQMVGADAGFMALVSPDGQTLVQASRFNLPEALGQEPPLPKGQGLSWQVIDRRQAQFAAHYPEYPHALPSWVAAGIRSLIGVPILAGDECLGELGVASLATGRALTEQDLSSLEAIGRQAGTAIRNARLYQAEQDRAKQLATLEEVGRTVATLADLPDLLEAVYQQARKILPADFFFVALYDEVTNRVSFPLIYEGDTKLVEGPQYLPETTMTIRTIRTGRPILRNDPPGTLGFPEEMLGDPTRWTLSMLFAPLTVGDSTIGVMTTQSYASNAYTEADLELFTGLARQCAVAIHNAQLFNFTRRQLDDLTLLHTSALASAADLTEAELLREFLQLIESALHPDVYSLTLWDEAAGVLRTYPASHVPSAVVLAAPIVPGQGIVGTVAATRQVIRLDDVRGDLRYIAVDPAVRAELCVPIESGGRLIGVINVESYTLQAFSAADERLLLTLGGQLATAIARCRATEALRQLNAELEARVHERTAQLEAANRELEAFAYSISHDLRAPLRAIEGFSRILLDEYAPRLGVEGGHFAQRVNASALRMSQLIDDLLAFARLGRRALSTQLCDPAALVQAAWEELRPPAETRAVEFHLEVLPPCRADPALLRQVFLNLLSNALKYTRPRPTAQIEVGWAAGAYYVRDNGVGFDMQYAGRLFGVFQRLHSVDEFEGTGVGLAIVKRIIERHGGRVWADAAVDQGATFYFTLA